MTAPEQPTPEPSAWAYERASYRFRSDMTPREVALQIDKIRAEVLSESAQRAAEAVEIDRDARWRPGHVVVREMLVGGAATPPPGDAGELARPYQAEARRLAARTLAEWEETEGADLASTGESLDRLELRISHALEEIAETATDTLQSERTAAASEVQRLQAIIERDRTEVARGLGAVRNEIRAREWLRLGRGSYEYNDDRWRDEFAAAIDAIEAAMDPLRRVASNLTDSPITAESIAAARTNGG